MRGALLVIAISACGRFSFDPIDERAGDAARDGVVPRDGSDNGDGNGDSGPIDAQLPDALPAACANAIAVQVNTPITRDTCVTGQDVFDGCGPAGRQEVVFKFVVLASAGYTARAFNTGTTTVSNVTGRIDAPCSATTNCAGLLGQSYAAGTTQYFVVEASGTACATIDFSVTQP